LKNLKKFFHIGYDNLEPEQLTRFGSFKFRGGLTKIEKSAIIDNKGGFLMEALDTNVPEKKVQRVFYKPTKEVGEIIDLSDSGIKMSNPNKTPVLLFFGGMRVVVATEKKNVTFLG